MDLIGDQIDSAQYGASHASSTVHVLVDSTHDCSAATGSGSGKVVRVLLLDYRKAFGLIDRLPHAA